MITTIRIETNDADRDHIKNLLDRKASARLASRRDISDLVMAFIDALAYLSIDDLEQTDAVQPDGYIDLSPGQKLISDINAGAWSFIGQPPTS